MKIFLFDNIYSVACKFKATDKGFSHTANLYKNDIKIETYTTNYLNRAWESFEFETAVLKVIDKHFKDNETERIKYRNIAKNYQ